MLVRDTTTGPAERRQQGRSEDGLTLSGAGGDELAWTLPAASPQLLGRVRGIALGTAAKRALDILLSALALLVLTPLIAVIALAVVLDSRGGPFYRAERVGFRGQRLRMLKFRKMPVGATGLPLTTDDDARLTRVGAFLAKYKLDEMPQFWHILKGEMSIVGPRPETLDFVRHHAREYDVILSVRPGLVGFSQLAFHEESRILDDDDPLAHYVEAILPQKVSLDVMYARGRTFATDLRVILWSLVSVLLRWPVAVHRGTGRLGLRRR